MPLKAFQQQYAHIYIFVQDSERLPLLQSLFYVGSTKNIRGRIYQHIRDMMPQSFANDNDQHGAVKDKRVKMHQYIQQHVGYDNFRVYILDHVPIHERQTHERVYYDMMTDSCYNLYNSIPPGPENPHLINDKLRSYASAKLQTFIDNNLCMTVEDDLLNALMTEYIKMFNPATSESSKVNNNRLTKHIGQLKSTISQWEATNNKQSECVNTLTRENDLMRTLNNHLTFRVETLSNHIQSLTGSLSNSQQHPIIINNITGSEIDIHKLNQEKEALIICIADLKSKLQSMENSSHVTKTTAMHILDQKHNKLNESCKTITSIPTTEDKRSKIPCEYCNKQISRNNMAAHKRICQKRTKPTYEELEQEFEKYRNIVTDMSSHHSDGDNVGDAL